MVKLEKISKKFENKVLFEDLSFTINAGEFTVIAGPSGSGKTTLLNIIGGLEKVDTGRVIVGGIDITRKTNRRFYMNTVGFLFQNFALVDSKTVKANLGMVQKSTRSGYSIEEALDFVGMTGEMATEVYKLSGGEQQRVALARLLYKKCDLILADEPTGSLDKENAAVVISLLHKLNDMGKTVIVVTHDENIIGSEKRIIRIG